MTMSVGWRTLSRHDLARLAGSDEFERYDRFPQGRVLDVRSADGTSIHTEVFGPENGYPIVLSHGICCGIRFWANQIAVLSTEYRVIAFDHRGHGRSGRPARGGWTVPHLGDDLAAVLRTALGPSERALIVGHSMGGIAIQAWAHRYPDDVARRADSIALINSTPGDIGTGVAATISGGRLRKPLSTLVDRLAPIALKTLGGIPVPARLLRRMGLISPIAIGRAAAPAARALVQELVLTTLPPTRGRLFRTLLALRDGQFDASRLTAPTLVIGSTDDQLLGFAASERLASRFPNSLGLVVLPGGHCAPLEQPMAVSAALWRLTGLRGKACG
ncbi:alpha/beta fold hydrolase [Nocardia pseudovaccinii]|uniref:alpha/beta fold hydrolase n=1 Tax=Nocardia pseudovaccinii TaxID=189540 RepID=UPI000A838C15|nr:alpha/beta hydrolase [Nocardia pseudovaccinii]